MAKLALPPLKKTQAKSATSKAAPKSALEAIGEKVGKALGKKIRAVAIKKGKQLLGVTTPSEDRRAKKKADREAEIEGRLTKGDIATAAGIMGHAGKGTPHKITPADARARSVRLAKARRIWQSLTPSKRKH